MRHSIAWPRKLHGRVSGQLELLARGDADLLLRPRSTPVTISVTGCSTWTRVFISMK